jgi:transcriptional regulator with GAF, ATPase, and Fis domain
MPTPTHRLSSESRQVIAAMDDFTESYLNVADLESVVSTRELSQRPARAPDYASENRALVALAEAMAASPDGILQKLADVALDLGCAQSAGLSLLEEDGKRFRWRAIAGQWASHLGGGTPRDFGPCGTVLDRRTAILFSHPERHFTYLAAVAPPMHEGLLIPFEVGGQMVGTIWIMSHDQSCRFDAEDLRVMTSLSKFAAAAYQTQLSLNAVVKADRDLRQTARALNEATHLAQTLKEEKLYLEDELRVEGAFDEIIGKSTMLREVLKEVETVAATDASVLILGETGTGKELIARAIHRVSARKDHAFVRVNCAAIPAGLLESELFGHERGAFTGAVVQKLGRLDVAHRGTVFLDEVGDLPLDLQPKLLRLLQEHEFERLGSTRTIRVDVRIIAATNRRLAEMVSDGRFRDDLYYRLRVFPIIVPPLRDHREDIPALVRHFVKRHSARLNKPIKSIATEAMDALMRWHWPGNVRELENFIERAVILTQGASLHVPLTELALSAAEVPASATFEAIERSAIVRALRASGGVIGGPRGAAIRLGLKRTTLTAKMHRLGISRKQL